MRIHASRGSRTFLRGGVVSQGLLLAGLVVLAVGAIGLTLFMVFRGEEPQGALQQGMPFQCGQCNEKFVKDPKDLTTAELNARPTSLRVDCPKCNAAGSGVPTMECPECKNQFTPASHTDPAGKRAGTVKDICPKCGTDRDKWYAEFYSKKKKR